MSNTREPGRSTASRLFAVLEAFKSRGPLLSFTEIGEITGLPLATTHRVTRELLKVGALERNADGMFQIGLHLWELGALAPRQRDLRRVAQPMMASIHEATGEVVQLVIFENGRAICVEKISGSRAVGNVTEVARALPLHATAVGKVILAFSGEHFDDLIGARLRRFTPQTLVDRDRLRAEVEKLRQEYVGYCREEFTLGTASVASPIFDADGHFVAALGILSSSPVGLPRLAPAIRTAALSVSQRMGYLPVGWPSAAYA